jgi:hypothetical protein
MRRNNKPRREGETNSGATPPHSTAPTSNATPDSDTEKKRARADTVNEILKGIPLIGPYLTMVKTEWGWTGLLLLMAGFLIAAALVFTGHFPEQAVSDVFKNRHKGYELKAQDEISWDAAIRNARNRILALGIALSKLDPKLIAGKVKEGVTAQVIYLNPCHDTIRQRQNDENNQDAVSRIKANLQAFGTHTKDFNPALKSSLQVKLTDIYPTMVVVIIDDDLYAYFCPHNAECTTSPVLVFKDFRGKTPPDVAAQFFESQFNNISNSDRTIPLNSYEDPCPSTTR